MSKGELITIPHMNEKSQYYCSKDSVLLISQSSSTDFCFQ